MGLFPMSRRMRCYMGPHMTCMMTAESYVQKFNRMHSHSTFSVFLSKSLVFSHCRFMMYFTAGIVSMALFVLMTFAFFISYFAWRLFLRFQFKLTVFIIMLGREHIPFHDCNTYMLYYLHIMMMLIGGFGWLTLLFIELWIYVMWWELCCTLSVAVQISAFH